MHRPAGDGSSTGLLLLLRAGRREREGGGERGGGDSSMELLKLIVAEWRQKHGTAIALYLLGRGRSRGLLMPILAGEERGSIRLLLPQPVVGIQHHNTANAPTCWEGASAKDF